MKQLRIVFLLALVAIPSARGETAIFKNVTLAEGIATDRNGNVFTDGAGALTGYYTRRIYKFSSTGAALGQIDMPDGGYCKMDRDPGTDLIWALCGSALFTVNPNNNTATAVTDIVQLNLDKHNVFDVEGYDAGPSAGIGTKFSGTILERYSTYNDIALFRKGTDLYALIAAKYTNGNQDFVVRLRISTAGAKPTVAESRVIMASAALNIEDARGIAVNPQGRVLAFLPVRTPADRLRMYATGHFVPVSFPYDFDPDTGAKPQLFKNLSLSGRGSTADSAGNFYVAADVSYGIHCGIGSGPNGLVILTPDLALTKCMGAISALSTAVDVAVDEARERAYMTAEHLLDQNHEILRYAIPANWATPEKPDLAVTAVTTPATTATAGDRITASATVGNQGGAAAGAFRLQYYLSSDTTISAADIDTTWGCEVSNLGPGSSFTCSGEVGIPDGTPPGRYYLGALADSGNSVGESIETNNGRAAAAALTVTSVGGQIQKPDLAVTEFSSALDKATKTLSFKTVVKNQGTADAGAFWLDLYLSGDAAITTSDRDAATIRIDGLGAGMSYTWERTAAMPDGKWYAGILADSLNQVSESDEANNLRTATGVFDCCSVPVPGPSFSAAAVVNGASFQAGVVPGSWVTIQGSNLSNTTRAWESRDFSGKQLPTTLDNVRVTFDGKPAAISYISPTQINLQAPAFTGPATAVEVIRGGTGSGPVTVTGASRAPALFSYTAGSRMYPAGVFPSGVLVGDPAVTAGSRKARPGERLLLYATGLAVSPCGVIIDSPVRLNDDVTVQIGPAAAIVEYAGLVSTGLFQINIVVPGVPAGEHPIVVRTGGQSSPASVLLPVGQ